jgi:hypothetical protein
MAAGRAHGAFPIVIFGDLVLDRRAADLAVLDSA